KKLIDNLLSATRFATGTVAPDYTRVQVSELIESALKAHKHAAEVKSIELLSEIRGPERILIDPNQVLRAIGHLVENGVKFGPENSRVQVRCWAETLNSESDRNWVVSVTDSGPGIPLIERQHVCEPFYQIDGRVTRRHGGAGLGLAIVDRVAKAHGGSLAISQSESGGAQMIFRIPSNGPQSKTVVERVSL
ncbi:MAG: HAMP domain-containing sensor histidine kinase, partial [Myxococcota bacterium]|nr:HAMP domain-containing sensor histidine kinase [Myxococcota bacterium]